MEIIKDMSHEEYLTAEGLSSSRAKVLIRETPFHFKYYEEHPRESSEAQIFGKAFHAMMEGMNKFNQEFFMVPKVDKRTREGKLAYEKAVSDNEGKTPLSQDEWESLAMMYASAKEKKVIQELMSNGLPEVSLFWTDADTGVKCKARPDFLTENCIIDFKTTRSSPRWWQRWGKISRDFGYDFQAAWYLNGLHQVTGEEMNNFVHIVCETSPPYLVACYVFSESAIERAMQDVKAALSIYKKCVETNTWEGVPDQIMELYMPDWVYVGEST